jgi:hypothetical protein
MSGIDNAFLGRAARRWCTPLGLLWTMAACGEPAPPTPGSFTATVSGSGAAPEGAPTGSADTELTGEAAAWTAEAGERRTYEIRLQPAGTAGTAGASIIFATVARRRPAQGAYAVTEQAPDSASFDVLYAIGGAGRVVKGTGGEVVITAWDRRHVEGRFDVVGRLLDLSAPAAAAPTVRLSGTFTAPCTAADGGACD